MELNEIALSDLNKSVPLGEFLAVREVLADIHFSFLEDVEKKYKRIEDQREEIDQMEKKLSKYDPQVRKMRKEFELLEETINEMIFKKYNVYLNNYEGITEFLIRFNIVGEIKRIDISPYFNNVKGYD